MDFFSKVEETITAKGQVAVDKVKEFAEVASLRGQISTCEDMMKRNYMEIGRIYYENFGDMPEALFEKQCRNIKNAQRSVEEYEKQIREIKGI